MAAVLSEKLVPAPLSRMASQHDMSSLPSHIQPQGFAATILGVTILLSILCLLAVSLRLWVRIRDRCFYNEDGFMIAGLVSFPRALPPNCVLIKAIATRRETDLP